MRWWKWKCVKWYFGVGDSAKCIGVGKALESQSQGHSGFGKIHTFTASEKFSTQTTNDSGKVTESTAIYNVFGTYFIWRKLNFCNPDGHQTGSSVGSGLCSFTRWITGAFTNWTLRKLSSTLNSLPRTMLKSAFGIIPRQCSYTEAAIIFERFEILLNTPEETFVEC